MNRLFRRIHRRYKSGSFLDRLLQRKQPGRARLVPEQLEHRLLLTTLTLPADAIGETRFVYADAGENEPGSDISTFNDIRIGTLSGQAPGINIKIEILDNTGSDIGGTYYEATEFGSAFDGVALFGGPGGGQVIDEVPPDVLSGIGYSVDALATDSVGNTYGITSGGLLLRLDTSYGTIDQNIGSVIDTDSQFYDVSYSDFSAATFARDSGSVDVLYAVATGPTQFDILGMPIADSYESVLITVNTETGEAEPVGRDVLGQSSYELSQIKRAGESTNVTTIVFSQEGHNVGNLTDEPVFLGYDANVIPSFITVSVNKAASGPAVTVLTADFADVDAEDIVVQGLMYDSPGRLFGLHDKGIDNGGVNDGKLVLVDLYAAPENRFIDVIEYGDNPSDNNVYLTGMSFDVLNNMGYATDPSSGTLYRLNVARMEQDEGDYIIKGIADVFMVYIAQSTPDVYITFTRFTDTDPLTYTPTGGEPVYLFTDEDTAPITTPADAGGVMIGTQPGYIPDDDNIHWLAQTFFNSSVMAPDTGVKGVYPGGDFRPGIWLPETAQDDPRGAGLYQNIGKIQVGGGVFGDVRIEGSIDTFYAGYLATNDFVVEGDMNNLVVATIAGGIPESDNSWTPVGSVKYGGDGVSPILDVRGRLGSFYCVGDWGLPIRVHGRSDAPEFPGVLDIDSGLYAQTQREIERKIDNLGYPASAPYFMNGAMDRADGSFIIVNDSPYNAQYLGTVDSRLSVVGEVESIVYDSEDFYSFAMMAGETVEIQLYDTNYIVNYNTGHPYDPDSQMPLYTAMGIRGGLDLFDPELNWVGNLGEVDMTTGAPLPLTFTAQEAGIYTVAVNGVFGGFKVTGFSYRLEVTGLSSKSLGGGNVLSDMRSESHFYYIANDIPNIQVISGNMGALSVGGYIRECDFEIIQGDLSAIRVGANAIAPNHLALRNWDAEISAEYPAGEMGFGYEIDDNPQSIPYYSTLYVGGDLGRISSTMKSIIDITVAGDLQSLRIGDEIQAPEPGADDVPLITDELSSFVGAVAVAGNIGEIRIQGDFNNNITSEFGNSWAWLEGGIFANADGEGQPGVIDSIVVGGNFNAVVSVGARGGNVRYVDIVGGITHFSGGWAEDGGFGPFTFYPGQAVTITDDSGSRLNIAPGFTGEQEDELLVQPGQIGSTVLPGPGDEQDDQDDQDGEDDEDDEEVLEGGVLTIKLLPVLDILPDDWNGHINRTELGYAIVSIDSTDGLRITADGGPVEIGSITADGINDSNVIIGGSNPVSVMRITVPPPVAEVVEDTTTGTTTGTTDTEDEEEYERIGISQVVNASGYWEHLRNGRWVVGTGPYQRWIGGDVIAIQIGGSTAAGTTTGDAVDDTTAVNYIQDYPFGVVKVGGNLGSTSNSTGQVIKSRLMSIEEQTSSEDPGGEQHNGLLCEVGVQSITVSGSLGDVDVRSGVHSIVINDNNTNEEGQFHGVAGAIAVHGDLTSIRLGDGIPSPGTGYFAQSGVFVFGTLTSVEITGSGNDIGGPVFAVNEITKVSVSNGARIIGYNASGGDAERVRGSFGVQPTLNVTASLGEFFLEFGGSISTGPITFIEVCGTGSEIRGAGIQTNGINRIYVGGGANGIFDSRIYAFGSGATDQGVIRDVVVGGEGIHNTIITANRDLVNLTVLPGGTLSDSEIRGEYHVGSVTANEINRTDIDAINKLDRVTVNGNIFDLEIEAGELGQLTATEIFGSAIMVAGPVSMIQTRGDLISTIELTGPFGDLRSLYVGGDFGTPTGGFLSVDGKIGMIRVAGDFEAEMLLNWQKGTPTNPQGFQKYDRDGIELSHMMVMGRMDGFGDIGGDVGMIYCAGDFGQIGSEMHVHGDLRTLLILSTTNSSDLQNDLTVDGNLGMALVFGSVDGDINVMDNFSSLLMVGLQGRQADLNGDIDVGGDFNRLTIIGGDRYGDLSVQGRGPLETIIGSDIDGTTVVGGGPGITIDGSITGNGRYFSTGSVDSLHIKGDIDEGGVVFIDGDLGSLTVDGSIEGLVHVTGDIGTLRSANMGLDASGMAPTVTAAGDIGQINISETLMDGYVLAGFDPGVSTTVAGILDGTIKTNELENVQVLNELWKELSVDGTLDDPNERALAGDIRSARVGLLYNSVIAAGVSPGANNVFGDMDGSDEPGTGTSSIGTVFIGDVIGDGNAYGVFADSAISLLCVNGVVLPTPVMQADGFHAWTLTSVGQDDIGGFVFEPGKLFRAAIEDDQGEQVSIMVLMSGMGTGQVLLRGDGTGIEAIQMSNTNSMTSVQVIALGAATVNVDRIFNGDDEDLGTLSIDGLLGSDDTEGSMDIGGSLNSIRLAGTAPGSEITIGGNVRTADLGTVNGEENQPVNINIVGDLGRFSAQSLSDYVTVTAGGIESISVMGTMAGDILGHSDKIRSVSIRGDMTGVISSDGDIDQIMVNGIMSGGIRAGWNIGTLISFGMNTGTVAAGGDFGRAIVLGDVRYSTLAAGLDAGDNGDPFSGADVVSGRGDLGQVLILGDFVESNIASGISPGADGMFGTSDDRLHERAAEEIAAPQIVGVEIDFDDDGTDFSTINVQFADFPQGRSSNIGDVRIFGSVEGSTVPSEQFAITASGTIGSVVANQKAFSQSGNVARSTVSGKDIQASLIDADNIGTLEQALASAFIVQTDGLDHSFDSFDDIAAGSSDDTLIYGGDVWVQFDPLTNIASFHKDSGFTTNLNGTNYYKITLDETLVVNRQGVQLDGEFTGQWPTGDGVPGNNPFEYYFAVGDLGDTHATAFSPFVGEFPENAQWTYSSILGDNLDYDADEATSDSDYIRMDGLEKGQILSIDLTDRTNAYSPWGYSIFYESGLDMRIWYIEPSSLAAGAATQIIDPLGRDDLDPQRDLVAPNLDELAYTGGSFYGYDDQGQQFYTFARSDLSVSRLDTDLDDLNALPEIVGQGGNITNLRAIAGHSGDSIWAIAEIDTPAMSRESLVLISNLKASQADALQADIIVSDYDITDDFTNVTALTQFQGLLYGIDQDSHTLVTIVCDTDSADFGKPTEVGNLENDELIIVGLDVNPDGTALIALHDQPVDSFNSLLNDGLYQIDPATGEALLWQDFFTSDTQIGGLAAEQNGDIIIGLPLRGTPIDDTMKVTVGTDTVEHTFGSGTSAHLGHGAVTLTSDPTDTTLPLQENALQQEFIDGNFYYVFNVQYSTELSNVTVTVSGIDWINSNDYGEIVSVVTDDPDNVAAIWGWAFDSETYKDEQYITLRISARDGDGDVKVYFAGTAGLAKLGGADLALAGEVIGPQMRTDLEPARDMIMPNMDELTIAPEILSTHNTVELTDSLLEALSEDLIERLQDGVTNDEMIEVQDELAGHSDYLELVNGFFEGLTITQLNALGYDSQQEIFALISTTNYNAMPIMVTDPDNSLAQVPLTLDVLTEIYQQSYPDIIFEEIRGLEFGLAQDAGTTDPFAPAPAGTACELFAVVTYTKVINEATGLSTTHDALLRIADITDPTVDTVQLAVTDLLTMGFGNVTELALGQMPGDDPDNGKLYAYDAATDTLLLIDGQLWKTDSAGSLLSNMSSFGNAVPLGGADAIGNLSDPSGLEIDIVAMDFDSQSRLLAVEDSLHALVEISTATVLPGSGNSRIELVQILPAENAYQAIAYDSSYEASLYSFFAYDDGSGTTSQGYLVRMADGTPLNDPMDISVKVGAAIYNSTQEHIFGQANATTVTTGAANYVEIASSVGNTDGERILTGGFYQFQLDYSTGQGEILLTIDDIGWLEGIGDVDSVALSNEVYASVADFDDSTLTILIDTGTHTGAERSVTIYFGATSDLQVPATVQYAVSQVAEAVGAASDGRIDFSMQLPEDGSYLIQVGSYYDYWQDLYGDIFSMFFDFSYTGTQTAPVKYDMNVMVFDDGNGDFGIAQTLGEDHYAYDQTIPSNQPTNLTPDDDYDPDDLTDLSPNDDLVRDPNYGDLYRTDHPAWPITVSGSLLSPGQAGTAVIDSELADVNDLDFYSLQLQHGQRITIDIDAESLFGRDDVEIIVGIYNGDLETITTVMTETIEQEDIMRAEQNVDPFYTAQAIFTMPNHGSVIIDPSEAGLGTYYVVVSGYGIDSSGFSYSGQPVPYRLSITTTQQEEVQTPPSQLVWLSFGDERTGTNATADYLYSAQNTGLGGTPDIVNRPAFYAEDFGLPQTMRAELIEVIADRIEEIYRNAGLEQGEIDFVTEKPAAGTTYSTVIFGGRSPVHGLAGIAESVDRGNLVHDDMAVVFTEDVALLYTGDGAVPLGPLSDDQSVRFDQVVTLTANLGAHELAHLFGLEHATEEMTAEPNNLMGYNDNLEDQELEPRNSYWYQLGGFTNEIDMLLRVIGSG